MYGKIKQHLQNELNTIQENGLYKKERIITSPQGAEITISTGETVLNFCANNYLGLSSHPDNAAINDLSEREKIVVTLYYFEGLTLAEIGEILGVTESRVCQIHTKAVGVLRGQLTEVD